MTETKPRNPFGVAALIVGIVLVALSTVTQVLYIALPVIVADSGSSLTDIVQSLFPLSIVSAVLAIGAIVLGIVGLVLPGRPRGAAAAGFALGGAALIGLVTTPIAGLILQATGS